MTMIRNIQKVQQDPSTTPNPKTASPGFSDNRPVAVSQRKQQQLMAESHRAAFPAINSVNPIQRMVWPIGRDETTESNYKNLTQIDPTTDSTGSLREPKKEDRPFDDLGESESLHLIGHGDGQGKIEGMTPDELVGYLKGLGLDPEKHKGTIRLVSCLSGTPTPDKKLYTEMFKEALEAKTFTNGVIGFNGLVRVAEGASVKVLAPDHVPTFDEIQPKLDTLSKTIVRLALTPPNADPKSPEHQQWLQKLEDLKTEAAQYRVKIEPLWEPQNKDTNMSILGIPH